MYTRAKKILGYWTIKTIPGGVVQFRSLSRKLANEWATLNAPIPASAVLNATIGRAVWRQGV